METTLEMAKQKHVGLDANQLKQVADKFSKINKLIESGKEITPELSKSFVSFPLSNDPFSGIE